MIDTVAQIGIDVFHACACINRAAKLVDTVQVVFLTCRIVRLTGFTAAPFNNPGIQFVQRVRTVPPDLIRYPLRRQATGSRWVLL